MTELKPTVFVVDSDAGKRNFIQTTVEAMGVEVRESHSAEELIGQLQRSVPGCIVTDFTLPGMPGIRLQETLIENGFTIPIVFVTTEVSIRLAVRAMENGAVTVLAAPLRHQELWTTIRTSIQRSREILSMEAKKNEVRLRLQNLTNKEREVLDALMRGSPNKKIASDLDLSARTVERRKKQIFQKTRTESVAELVRLVLQLGCGHEPSCGEQYELALETAHNGR